MGTSKNATDILNGIDSRLPFLERLRHLSALEWAEIPDVSGHASNVAQSSGLIAEQLGMSERQVDNVYFAARWHDIGKLAVDKEVLFKPGRLSQDEFHEMKLHAAAGVDLLGPDAPRMLVNAAAYHHERYDGFGYNGLKNEEIPLEARIIAVADVHDALVAKREYKDPMPEQDALILMTGDVPSPGFGRRGFDPIILRLFVAMRLADPKFAASDENRAKLTAYRDSNPMDDLSPEAIAEGWVLKKSGHRLKYDNGPGVPKLEVMFDPAGQVTYRRPDQDRAVEFEDSASACRM